MSDFSRWARENPDFDLLGDLSFQCIDIDGFDSEIRIFGVTKGGHSVLARVRGFHPYLYCRAPLGFKTEHCKELERIIDRYIRENDRRAKESECFIHGVELVNRTDIYGFHPQERFLKITLTEQRHLKT